MSPEYLAGFVDGEGCVLMVKTNECYFPRLTISNTNEAILREIAASYGGWVGLKNRNTNTNWKPAYHWAVSAWSAVDVLRTILPHLRLKREQAQLALQWADGHSPRARQTADKLERYVAIKERISKLNQRGLAA